MVDLEYQLQSVTGEAGCTFLPACILAATARRKSAGSSTASPEPAAAAATAVEDSSKPSSDAEQLPLADGIVKALCAFVPS